LYEADPLTLHYISIEALYHKTLKLNCAKVVNVEKWVKPDVSSNLIFVVKNW